MIKSEKKVNLKEKIVMVIDNGLFVELAIRLSKGFKKVYYYTHWESAFPTSLSTLIGAGLDEIERCDDYWSKFDEIDLWVFPDVYDGGLQEHLRSLGKRVWGGGYGEELELDRVAMKEHIKKLGMPMNPYKVICGLDNLRKHLEKNDDKWIKISKHRGDFESFHHDNYNLSEPRLDELEHKLGARKYTTNFVVEDALNDCIEVGYDGYTIDGEYPTQSLVGFEIKDLGYIGIFKKYEDLPKEVTEFNEKIKPTLKNYHYRGFASSELRIDKKKTATMIDFCARAGSPPSEVYQEFYTNLPEIVWKGSEGIVVDPIPAGKFAVEVLIHSAWADKNWQAVEFPEEIRQWVKLRNLTKINGKYYVIPQSVGLPEIGAVLGIGNTLEEAIEKVKVNAEQVKGYFIDIPLQSLDTAMEQIEMARSFGINII